MSNRNNSVSVHPLRRQIAIGDFVTFQHGDRWLCGTAYGADAGALDIITAEIPNPEVHPLLFGAREHVMNWRVPRIDAVRLVREDQQGARFARARSLAVAFMLRQEPESADMLAAAEIVEALGPVDEGANEPAPAERKPVAGWEKSGGVSCLAAGSLRAKVALENWVIVTECDGGLALTDTAAQLAAEDALFAIADAINALRGGR